MSTAVEGYGLMYNKDLLLEAGAPLPRPTRIKPGIGIRLWNTPKN